MPYKFNPFTGTLDYSPDTSGFVPFNGATQDLNVGSQYVWASGFGGSDESWGIGISGFWD